MKKRIFRILTIFLLLVAVPATVYRDWIPFLVSHVIHRNPLSFHNISIEVPFDWVVMEKRDDVLLLIKKGVKTKLSIKNRIFPVLNKETILENDLHEIKEKLNIKNIQIAKFGQITLSSIQGNYVDMVNLGGSDNKWDYYRIISLPKANIQIEYMTSEKNYESDMTILKNISVRK